MWNSGSNHSAFILIVCWSLLAAHPRCDWSLVLSQSPQLRPLDSPCEAASFHSQRPFAATALSLHLFTSPLSVGPSTLSGASDIRHGPRNCLDTSCAVCGRHRNGHVRPCIGGQFLCCLSGLICPPYSRSIFWIDGGLTFEPLQCFHVLSALTLWHVRGLLQTGGDWTMGAWARVKPRGVQQRFGAEGHPSAFAAETVQEPFAKKVPFPMCPRTPCRVGLCEVRSVW